MALVDPIFKIKRTPALLAMTQPNLSKEINNPISLTKEFLTSGFKQGPLESGNSIFDVINSAYNDVEDQKKIGRFKKFVMHEEMVAEDLHNDNFPLKDKIPIFVNGICITDETYLIKQGIDPYSHVHVFSNKLMEWMNNEGKEYPLEFLQKFSLVYVQPLLYFQEPHEFSGVRGFVDNYKDAIEKRINQVIPGIGFGTLEKFILNESIGNSIYDQSLFNLDSVKSSLETTPELFSEEIEKTGGLKKFLERKKYETYVNKRLAIKKFEDLLLGIKERSFKAMIELGVNAIPLYMEKTSDSADIITRAAKNISLSFHFIGGDSGMLSSGSGNYIPIRGIAESMAMRRLIGYIDSIHQVWKGSGSTRKKQKVTVVKEVNKIEMSGLADTPFLLHSSFELPFLLLEEGTPNKHPNFHDLARELLNDAEIKVLRDFAYSKRIGFARIEPRLVELFSINHEVYAGQRFRDKRNLSWKYELDGKKILTPEEIGILTSGSVKNGVGDFRGSEFSLPGSPIMNKIWWDNHEKGKTYYGCTLQKLIGKINTEKRKKYLHEELLIKSKEEALEFFKFHDENLESKFASRGTSIHKISSEPLVGLVHYKTLGLAGITPCSSDKYTETAFLHDMDFNSRVTRISFHPDCYLFLESNNAYDILIIDTKTNPVRNYPEHKYLLQTGLYALVLEDILKKQGKEVNNFYLTFNKNAFYKSSIESDVKISPHSVYRGQRFSPITLLKKDDPFRVVLPSLVKGVMDEKQGLIEGQINVSKYKADQEKCKTCKKCYSDYHYVCDNISEKTNKGIPLIELL